jgi:hypothetical protein
MCLGGSGWRSGRETGNGAVGRGERPGAEGTETGSTKLVGVHGARGREVV